MKILSLILFLFICVSPSAQNPVVYKASDLSATQSDSVKCKILDNLIENEVNDEVWIKYNIQMESIAQANLRNKKGLERLVYLKFLGNAFNNKAFYLENRGQIDSALHFYRESLAVRYDIKDKYGVSISLNNIGHIYFSMADYQNAINYYNKGIKVQEEIGEKAALGTSFNNMGAVYSRLKNNKEAARYYYKSLKLREEIKDLKGQAYCYNNLAKIYVQDGDLETALQLYQKSLKIREENNDLIQVGTSLNNIGIIYLKTNRYDLAQQALERALKIHLQFNDKQAIATSYYILGTVAMNQKKYIVSEKHFTRSIELSKALGFPEDISKPAYGLYIVSKETGNYKKALEMHELYTQMNDSSVALKTDLKAPQNLKEPILKTIEVSNLVNNFVSKLYLLEVQNNSKALLIKILVGILLLLISALIYLLFIKTR